MTERVIDVILGSDCWRFTINLLVSQRYWNTFSVTELYVKVHQTTATLQVSSLYNENTLVSDT